MTTTTNTPHILLVDSDEVFTSQLAPYLSANGSRVTSASSLAYAAAALKNQDNPVDLILLEVDLDGVDGRSLLSDPLKRSSIPTILLTTRGLDADVIEGLDMGADDYVLKPLSFGVLAARIKAQLRRSASGSSTPVAPLVFDGLTIDELTHEVTVKGEIVDLTSKEFALLTFLASSPRQVFSRAQLLASVWGSTSEKQRETTVTEHIRRIRSKIEQYPEYPRWLVTIPGSGYKFERRAPR
jgi:DNA-binding response OmpR family regulator